VGVYQEKKKNIGANEIMLKVFKPFYFVRHGITHANMQKLWCGGEWDIELSEQGHEQAKAQSQRIFESEVDVIFTSPMKRAKQTTHHLNSIAKKPVIEVEGLREWKVGALERQPWTTALLGTPIKKWPDPPGGESVSQFRERIINAVNQCLSSADCPLISSHGAVGRMLLDILDVPDLHIDNCKLHRIYPVEQDGRTVWKLV
jgi:broad specificity phosphatase PhoE